MNDAAPIPIDRWAVELQPVIDASHGLFKRIVVLDETDSTQDAARRMDAKIGDVILAGRQTAGRGRLGRGWADTGEHGVAMTVVMKAERSERLAIASAVSIAGAIQVLVKLRGGAQPVTVGIKWPNDVMVNGRKVAGILIEQLGGHAMIGIGINVRQTSWPEGLTHRAISLVQIGLDVDRIHVIDILLQGIAGIWRMSDEEVNERFRQRDVLRGSMAAFRFNGVEYRGTVMRIDPMRGLAVRTDNGEVWLTAAHTTVMDWHFPVRGD
jgi:BirA family transcriptional regulator, biotin operon repressor / biotin---[acetyl-CoA-carboxylase] ligase